MSSTDQRSRYQKACEAGRAWAAQELAHARGNLNTVDDLERKLYEVTAAYVAIQTGRLPSLFFNPDTYEEQHELGEGFYNSASDVLSEFRRSHAA